VPLDPFRRDIVYSFGHTYGFGSARWGPSLHLSLEPGMVPTNMADPAIAAAASREKKVADFLYWSRLPFATIERSRGRARVTLGDARYNSTPSDGPFSVTATVPE
jgi:inner membrane protein